MPWPTMEQEHAALLLLGGAWHLAGLINGSEQADLINGSEQVSGLRR